MNCGKQCDSPRARAERRADELTGFYCHLLSYIFVNIALCAINLLTQTEYLWFIWPLVGWGIGLAAHAIGVFVGGPFSETWRERKIEELLARDKVKK